MQESATQHITGHTTGFARKRIENMLSGTGVSINGSQPWDIQVSNPSFFNRVLINGSLGLGESYLDGYWDCEQVDETINLILRSELANSHKFLSHIISYIQATLFNLQKSSRAFQVGEEHYDVGNDLYARMLDNRMTYTCGYWARAKNLDDAQEDKLDLICRKMDLQQGMKILDIGCGWGSFAEYAAKNYGTEVVGVTISAEQVKLGMERCKGLPVDLRLQDYREINENFDGIVSIGMFEHVGHKNYRTYMQTVNRCLRSGGRFLLHTIGKNNSLPGVDPWIAKYIFPNGEIPSLKRIAEAAEPSLIIEDVHNFGPDYDKTLMAWCQNFNKAWPDLKHQYSDRFYRMWDYYLKVCAGAFRARDLQLWQIVMTKGSPAEAFRRPE